MLPQLCHIYAGNKQPSSDTSVAVYFRSSSNVRALRRTSDPQLVALLRLGGRLREPHHMVRDHRQQLERGRVVTGRAMVSSFSLDPSAQADFLITLFCWCSDGAAACSGMISAGRRCSKSARYNSCFLTKQSSLGLCKCFLSCCHARFTTCRGWCGVVW